MLRQENVAYIMNLAHFKGVVCEEYPRADP